MQKCQKEIKCKKVKENKRKGQPKGQNFEGTEKRGRRKE